MRAFQLERGIDDDHFFAGFIDIKAGKTSHIMVQERIDKKEGGKYYVAWQPFDDEKWRRSEPDNLPLYRNVQRSKDKFKKASNYALLVEGAKAVRAAHEICEKHKTDPTTASNTHGLPSCARSTYSDGSVARTEPTAIWKTSKS